jgi:transketolase
VILIGTGSELQLAVDAQKILADKGISASVVSMPCVEWFEQQDEAYKQQVLPPSVRARVSVEAGVALGWRTYVGDLGESVSLEHFGASADYKTLYQQFGFTADNVAIAARASLTKAGLTGHGSTTGT